MRVIATAGHVDHGKSRLVRALTGMEPDRWAEERRRGMTIDLGYAWTTLASGEQLAFVDVPGHQRFVTNMLAGVGPAPAVLLVIAADEGWRRQTSEHLDAIDALGIRHGLIAVTRSDLATPDRTAAVLADARERVARSSLGHLPALAVSGETGAGLDQLRHALQQLVSGLPAPALDERVRLWVDRAFTVKGTGTVVTGTLGAGRIAVGDELELGGRPVVVRGLQQLAGRVEQAQAVARVAVNLRSVQRREVGRGDCLLTPGAWWSSDCLDVALEPLLAEPQTRQVLHIGSASIPVRLRLLGTASTGGLASAEGMATARLSLARPIPVQAGDRAVLRDPGQQSITAGVRVLDADPPALTKRGAARARAAGLADGTAAGLAGQVRRRGAVSRATLTALGVPVTGTDGVLTRGDWLIDADTWRRWQDALLAAVDRHAAAEPLQPWISDEAARQAVGLPEPSLLAELAAGLELHAAGGRIGRPGAAPAPAAAAERSLRLVDERLAKNPFDAPERSELSELGLGVKDLAAAARAGRVLRLAPDLVVAPDAVQRAMALVRALPQPFTASQARQALGTTRRVALPLLEHLDAAGLTVRVDGARRAVRT